MTDRKSESAWLKFTLAVEGYAHYLEGTIKAATFGLIRFEDIFLSFMELEPQGRTLGETVIPQIQAGQLALPKGDA